MAKGFRRGSNYEGFANFSAMPLELVKLIISLVATAHKHREGWSEYQMSTVHTDISRAYVHVPSKEEKDEECHGKV